VETADIAKFADKKRTLKKPLSFTQIAEEWLVENPQDKRLCNRTLKKAGEYVRGCWRRHFGDRRAK